MGGIIFWLFIGIRVLWNFAFLGLHPLVIVIVADLLDSKDSAFYIFTGETTKLVYDRVDKTTDLAFYISAIVYYFYFHRQLWYAWILGAAFTFRAVGNVIFLIAPETARWVPFVFPAFAMPWMVFYSFLDYGFVVRSYDQRWDRWLRHHTVAHVLIVVAILILWEVKEIIQWKDGNTGPPDDLCTTELVCASLIFPLFLVLILFAVYMGINRHPHFEPNSVRYTKGGIPVKTKRKTKKLQSVEDILTRNY